MAPAIKEIEDSAMNFTQLKFCVGMAGKISFIYILHFYSGRDISPWTFFQRQGNHEARSNYNFLQLRVM